MKIALCLSGYFDSIKDSTSRGDDGFDYIKKHILNGNNVDVFLHNWEPSLEKTLVKMYNPKKYIVEPQIDFNEVAEKHNVSRRHLDKQNRLGSWSISSKFGRGYVGPERILSHFYSIQRSFELKKQYEDENNFKYNIVIKARFDLGRINRKSTGPGRKNSYACQCINFDPTLDMTYFYQVFWNLFNEGPADMWFYSNSINMDNFCYLYDKVLTEYLQIGSKYSKNVVGGWPQSKRNDFRSNEMFKKHPSSDLHKYPSHMVVNTILLLKWFLIDCGLWSKSKALRSKWE